MLSEIRGMHRFSLSTAAGAEGEFAGVLMIRKYLRELHLTRKDEILVPDSAHGTNPASAAMGGFKVVKVPSGESGRGSGKAGNELTSEGTAGVIVTGPNTPGLFAGEGV